jgi:hypothetical protein
MGLQTASPHRGEPLDQSSRRQTMPWSWPRPKRDDRLAALPATCDERLRLPNVPALRPPQPHGTQGHHRRTAGGASLNKEAPTRTTGWTGSVDATRRYRHPPGGMTPHHVVLPVRGLLLLAIPRPGVMAVACPEDVGKASRPEPVSPRWGDPPGGQGQGPLGASHPFPAPCRLPTGEPANAQRRFLGLVTPLLGPTPSRQRANHRMDGADHPAQVWATPHLMASPTVPTPGASPALANTIPDPVVHGACPPRA